MIRYLRALPVLIAALPAPLFAHTSDSWLNPVSGDWFDATNWSAGVPANNSSTAYDVFISASGAPYTVSLSAANSTTISSLTLGDAQTSFNLNSPAILAVAGAFDLANSTFNLTGTLSLATIQSSGVGQFLVQPHNGTAGTTLKQTTLATSAFVKPGATLYVTNGLGLSNGSVHLQGNAANPAALAFVVQTVSNLASGTGSFVFDGTDNANSITLSNFPSGLIIQSGTSGGTVKNGPNMNGTVSAQTANATITLSTSQSLATSNTSLLQAINGGQLVVSAVASIGGILNVDGNSSVTFTANFAESSPSGTATLEGTGTINAASISGNFTIPSNTVHITGTGLDSVDSLKIGGSTDAWTGKLDIGNADLRSNALNGTPIFSVLQNQVRDGAIYSSNATASTAVALFTGWDYTAATGSTVLDGQTVGVYDRLFKVELLGDANLDGKVDLTDLSTVLNNLGQASRSWTLGNFDYAPTIDLTDLTDVLNGFWGGSSSGAIGQGLPTAAPEPGSLVLIALAAPLLLKRRR